MSWTRSMRVEAAAEPTFYLQLAHRLRAHYGRLCEASEFTEEVMARLAEHVQLLAMQPFLSVEAVRQVEYMGNLYTDLDGSRNHFFKRIKEIETELRWLMAGGNEASVIFIPQAGSAARGVNY